MNNFVFHNPVKIIFGKGTIEQIEKEIPLSDRVLITYGGGSVLKNGVMDQVRKALRNHQVVEFGGIEPNPKYHTLMKAVEVVKKENIDIILSVGGGSVLDGTKFIAAATYYTGEDAYDICRKGAKVNAAVPIADVITLAATGSEMNSGGVISNDETQEKFAFGTPLVFPTFSVLDPGTLYSLPKEQIANGIVDTFVHVLEQYLTYPVNTPLQDRFSEGILLTLLDEAPKLMSEGEVNYDSYANFMWAATCALNGYNVVGALQDWTTHFIGHEITALTGLAHARTLAIVLPGTLRHISEKRKEKLLQYASRIFDINEGDEKEIIAEVINKTENFFHSVGIKSKFSDYEVESNIVQRIQARFEARGQDTIGVMADIEVANLPVLLAPQLG